MPNLFARQVALFDVAGRLDYIRNPLRQEHLLSTYDTASDRLDGQYWQILARESQAAFEQSGVKTRTVKTRSGELKEQTLQCIEARELFFLLGNELIPKMDPDEILKTACEAVSKQIGRPVTGALHRNKSNSSLHVHILYSERELLQEPLVKVAERNLFFDAEGKRRYKKSEILDENKQLLPGCRIVSKGEIYESRCFGTVDKRMLEKDWLKGLKTDCILELRNGDLKGDVEITEYDPSTGMLPQRYIGNKVPRDIAANMEAENALVREYNAYVREGLVSQEEALMVQGEVNRSANKTETLTWYLEQIREREQEEEMEYREQQKKKASLSSLVSRAESLSGTSTLDGNFEGAMWQKYRKVRDETWECFIQGQRSEFEAIRRCREARRQLDFQNSRSILDPDGNVVGRKMSSRAMLQKNGYYEQRDEIKEQLKQHQSQLKTMRKYQEVAKGRQKIVRALLLAGAERDVINAAMRNYEQAMTQLQNYTNNPEGDFENRRLKAAQWSLAKAQERANAYIKKLEQEKLKEESRLEIQAEEEYQEFQKTGTVTAGSGRDPEARTAPELQVEAER